MIARIKAAWAAFKNGLYNITGGEYATFSERGKVVYCGPLKDMPPDVRARYDAMIAEGKAQLNEARAELQRNIDYFKRRKAYHERKKTP